MRRALRAVPVVLLASLAACPAADPTTRVPLPAPGGVASPASPSATSGAKGAGSWVEQAETVAKMLDRVVELVEKNDKAAALTACSDAYFVGYENTERNLEVASMTHLPEEPLDGRPRNVKIVREDLFAQIKSAVKVGAPAAQVRVLVDELANKIREDAKTLDKAQVQPR